MNRIKNTFLLGLSLLIPLSAVLFVLYKAFDFMVKIAKIISEVMPVPSILGVGMINILALLLVFLACIFLGIIANFKGVGSFKEMLEERFLNRIPGYMILKAYTNQFDANKKDNLQAVLVEFDDNAQLGFLVDSKAGEKYAVFLPDSPTPWSGSVVYVNKQRVKRLNISAKAAFEHLQQLGKNYSNIENSTTNTKDQ